MRTVTRLLVCLLPDLSQPGNRLAQSIHEAIRLVMCDADQCDQLRTLTCFLKLSNTCFGRTERNDLIISGMNRQNREAPLGYRCRRPAGHRNDSAEVIGILLCNVPCTGATHAETSDDDPFLIDAVAAEDVIEQLFHRAFIFGS